jgi:hypothetical protein
MTKKLFLLCLIASFFTLAFFSFAKVKAANAPALKEGTYLTGQTLSIWPSWSLLGDTLGVNLPSDPINQLAPAGTCVTSTNRFCINDSQCPAGESCVLHDPETGWSVANRRFTFACSKGSYAYRYIASTTPGVYTVRAHFEDTGIAPANMNTFVSSFVSTSIFKVNDSSGICNFDQEISSMQSGICGDGKLNLNKGEECDPPGVIEYANGCVGAIKNLKVCSKSCKWTASTTLCSSLSKCGNGTIEFGEICDDGILNGKYNHCNVTCNGVSPLGKCGDGILQSAYEICDPAAAGKEKYALTKAASCSWDCQNFGPYCGDTIVQNQYGEECDGSQTCSVDGSQGVKVCTNSCLKQDKDAAAWWNMEKLVFSQVGLNKIDDATANGNKLTCPFANCPSTTTGKYGNARLFNSTAGGALGGQRYLTAVTSPSLEATSSLTVEAWIFPTTTSTLYQRIIEKGGPGTGKGYDLEFNIAATSSRVRFNLWNVTQTSVDSKSSIPTGTWTHVVGTYTVNGTSNFAKIYINGVLDNTNSVTKPAPIMAKDTGALALGKSATALTNFFFGSLDEVKIYNRVLSADEVQNNFQSNWLCAATTTPVVNSLPGTCGDGVIDPNEACDRGTANNGRACAPTYGFPCSYCSADCQNTIDVQPSEYCGNGIIESVEKCDAAGDVVYAATTTPGLTLSTKDLVHKGFQELLCSAETSPTHTLRKGTKTCGDCLLGTTRNCVQCGVDTAGVGVNGNIINVLENPRGGTAPDPLFAKKIPSAYLSLSVSKCLSPTGVALCLDPPSVTSPLVGRAKKTSATTDLVSYTLLDPYSSTAKAAMVNSSPICSTGDTFNDKYQMYVNTDWTRPIDFPVLAEPQSWQYDLVLSPVVSSTIRAKDLRVVVSWVGSADFYSGVFNPFVTSSGNTQIEGSSYVFSNTPILCPISGCTYSDADYHYATGTNYFNAPANFKRFGVWYHGFNITPGRTSAEAFTIDTGNMAGNTYAFYVRSPNYPIRSFKTSAKLKVDVYLPELDSDKYHFGTPARTFYLLGAAPSDNQNARYWQVFNFNVPTSSGLSISNIVPIDTIITAPQYFLYTNPLVSNPACTNADWSYSYVPPCVTIWCTILCPSTGYYTVNWTKLTNCRTDLPGAVNHAPVENKPCAVLQTVQTSP